MTCSYRLLDKMAESFVKYSYKGTEYTKDPAQIEDFKCPICFELVLNQFDQLWPPLLPEETEVIKRLTCRARRTTTWRGQWTWWCSTT